MADWVDEERAEVVAKLNKAAGILTAAAASIKELAEDKGDVADMSNDAFAELVDMLRALGEDYDIAVMCEDALEADDEG